MEQGAVVGLLAREYGQEGQILRPHRTERDHAKY
jgi:hypothetical protein